MFLLLTTPVFAEDITIDTSTWTDSEKRRVQAAVSNMLHDDFSITHDGITVVLPTISVRNPSSTIAVLNAINLKTRIEAFEVQDGINRTVALAAQALLDIELRNTEMRDLTLDEVDTMINAISTLEESKTFLKKLVRFMVAAGFIR